MVADARPPEPSDESQDDLTITIHVERPKPGNPEGRIMMIAETLAKRGMREEVAARGPHNDQTIKRALQHVFDCYRIGRPSWVNRIDRNGREDNRGL